jgi:hypothetical protein
MMQCNVTIFVSGCHFTGTKAIIIKYELLVTHRGWSLINFDGHLSIRFITFLKYKRIQLQILQDAEVQTRVEIYLRN